MIRRTAALLSLFLFSLLCSLPPPVLDSAGAAAPADERGVGFQTFELRDPVGGKMMRAVTFYPSDTETKPTAVGPYVVDATKGAPYLAGRFPLVVFSHGSGGSRWDVHDFETYLARHGFVAASVDHPGDDFQDHSGLGTDKVLIGRPLQMSALITRELSDPATAEHIDPSKAGAAGFSAGGYTALVLAGARPDFGLLKQYCRDYPKDSEFCSGWSVQITRPDLSARRDPRVKAVFVMAPVGIYFDRAALDPVRIPVRIFAAGADHVLPLPANAERIKSELPNTPEYTVIPKADHFVFLSPCSPEMKARRTEICADPPGVDRAAIHAQIDSGAVRFFSRVFSAHSTASH